MYTINIMAPLPNKRLSGYALLRPPKPLTRTSDTRKKLSEITTDNGGVTNEKI